MNAMCVRWEVNDLAPVELFQIPFGDGLVTDGDISLPDMERQDKGQIALEIAVNPPIADFINRNFLKQLWQRHRTLPGKQLGRVIERAAETTVKGFNAVIDKASAFA